MTRFRVLVGLIACVVLSAACEYVVVPVDDNPGARAGSAGWSAVATGVETAADGATRIDLAIQNDTGDWSAMEAAGGSAVLTGGDGTTIDCDPASVGSGGHRLAPGFRMRGFIGGTKAKPETELIGVECAGGEVTPGSKLAIDYSYVTGEYNYYDPDASRANGRLEVNLDEIATDLAYPVAQPVEGLVQAPDVEITAINDVALRLMGAERGGDGLQSSWQTSNPGEYPAFVHIGNPPVIGSDGIIYGFYESPDLATVPLTPAGGEADWTTDVAVPADVNGLFMLLSVESKKQRLFVNYAIQLADG